MKLNWILQKEKFERCSYQYFSKKDLINIIEKYRIKSELLEDMFKELLELVYHCADFRNGVNYNGIDEGDVKCWEMIDNICKKYFGKNHNEVIYDIKNIQKTE